MCLLYLIARLSIILQQSAGILVASVPADVPTCFSRKLDFSHSLAMCRGSDVKCPLPRVDYDLQLNRPLLGRRHSNAPTLVPPTPSSTPQPTSRRERRNVVICSNSLYHAFSFMLFSYFFVDKQSTPILSTPLSFLRDSDPPREKEAFCFLV